MSSYASTDSTYHRITNAKARLTLKLALFILDSKSVNKSFSYFCLVLSYLQVLAIVFKTCFMSLSTSYENFQNIFGTFYKYLVLADLFEFSGTSGYTLAAMAVILGYVLVLLSLFINQLVNLYRRTESNPTVRAVWCYMTYLHQYFTFFLIHNFCLEILNQFQRNSLRITSSSDNDTPWIAYAIVIMVINLAFQVVVFCVCHATIKTKDLLASKGPGVYVFELVFKACFPLLWFLNYTKDWVHYLALAILLVYFALQDIHLNYTLPYYRVLPLKIKTGFQASVTLLSLLALIAKGISKTTYHTGTSFLILAWAVFLPPVVKSYLNILDYSLHSIFVAPTKCISYYHMLHFPQIFRSMSKKRQFPRERAMRKFDELHLAYSGKMRELLNKEVDENIMSYLNMETQSEVNSFMKRLFASTISKVPKEPIIKVNLIRHYIKHEKSYLYPYQLMEELLKDNPPLGTKLSVLYLRLDLEQKLIEEHESHLNKSDHGLNMLSYIRMTERNNLLKEKIANQVTHQVKFWKTFVLPDPDYQELVDIAKQVFRKKMHTVR